MSEDAMGYETQQAGQGAALSDLDGLDTYVQHLARCTGYDYAESSTCGCGAAQAIARLRRFRARRATAAPDAAGDAAADAEQRRILDLLHGYARTMRHGNNGWKSLMTLSWWIVEGTTWEEIVARSTRPVLARAAAGRGEG